MKKPKLKDYICDNYDKSMSICLCGLECPNKWKYGYDEGCATVLFLSHEYTRDITEYGKNVEIQKCE